MPAANRNAWFMFVRRITAAHMADSKTTSEMRPNIEF
jgi:hypothetical protein